MFLQILKKGSEPRAKKDCWGYCCSKHVALIQLWEACLLGRVAGQLHPESRAQEAEVPKYQRPGGPGAPLRTVVVCDTEDRGVERRDAWRDRALGQKSTVRSNT